jgi:hypothetical protein
MKITEQDESTLKFETDYNDLQILKDVQRVPKLLFGASTIGTIAAIYLLKRSKIRLFSFKGFLGISGGFFGSMLIARQFIDKNAFNGPQVNSLNAEWKRVANWIGVDGQRIAVENLSQFKGNCIVGRNLCNCEIQLERLDGFAMIGKGRKLDGKWSVNINGNGINDAVVNATWSRSTEQNTFHDELFELPNK